MGSLFFFDKPVQPPMLAIMVDISLPSIRLKLERSFWKHSHQISILETCSRFQTPCFGLSPNSVPDRKSTRLNSSHVAISYAVYCLKQKKSNTNIIPLSSNVYTL